MIRKNVGCRVALLACVLFSTRAALAQQGSGIAGVVRDTSGSVLPGVTVEASSSALIEKVRTVVTDEQGRYSIVDLRPGTYAVTSSFERCLPTSTGGLATLFTTPGMSGVVDVGGALGAYRLNGTPQGLRYHGRVGVRFF